MKALSLTRLELLRTMRDRSNLFFILVFPLLLVIFIGAQFGGGATIQIAVHHEQDDPVAATVVDDLAEVDGWEVVRVTPAGAVRDLVEGGRAVAGIELPPGLADAVEQVEPIEVVFHGRPDGSAVAVEQRLRAVLATIERPGQAAQLAAVVGDDDQPHSLPGLRSLARELAATGDIHEVQVTTSTLGQDELAEAFAGLGQFDLGASSQLFLFTFLTSLAGSGALIQTRRYGVATRMLATPTSPSTVLLGLAGGRLGVAGFQAVYLIAATWLLFRVNWGAPLATGLVVTAFCVLSAGAGMLLGASVDNDSQASGAGVGIGLGMAALGGSMVPLELFPDTMATVARLTPHAWANEAMAIIVREDGTVGDILIQLAVLTLFATVVTALAVLQLRRRLLP